MQNSYYKLPLRLDLVIQKKQHQSCSLKDSIAQNLHLIISTYKGEAAFSEDYGCSLWDEEFNIQLNMRWKENLCESLTQAIRKFEKRFQMNDIKVTLEEHNEVIGRENLRVRKRVRIEMFGVLKKTNEALDFRDLLFISPLAQK